MTVNGRTWSAAAGSPIPVPAAPGVKYTFQVNDAIWNNSTGGSVVYYPTPASGTATALDRIYVTFSPSSSSSPSPSPSPTPTEYGSVTFVEDGFYQYAQEGYTWSVTINNETKSGATAISFSLPYGTYEYEVTPPKGMTATPSSGTITINSPGPTAITINFSGSPSVPPPTPTQTCGPLSYSESLSGYECFGTPDTPCENARAIFRAFTDTIEDAPQQSYKGPTLAYDPSAADGHGAYAWFADGQEFANDLLDRCDRSGMTMYDAYLKYMNDHFSEAQLLGIYWTDCYWFLYVLYPGVSYTAVNPQLNPAQISSASQIAPGLTFIGPISLISAFASSFGEMQGAGVPLNGCSSSTVADHIVTFVESGLPSGTTWEGPTVEMGSWVSGGNTSSTTEFQIIIPYAETFTAHDVLVPTSSGVVTYHPNPASGTANPGETIKITYSPG